jgi:hypothetical protein
MYGDIVVATVTFHHIITTLNPDAFVTIVEFLTALVAVVHNPSEAN